MSLSLIFFLLIPLFLIPAILITTNRIRIYFYCSAISTVLIGILVIVTSFLPDILSETTLAQPFIKVFSFLFINSPNISPLEQSHIICQFLFLIGYLLIYLICYIFYKIFYIGTNPAIRKPTKVITKIAFGIGFFICTYIPLNFFLINTRLIFPFPDGFLTDFFNIIYLIEA